MDDQPIFTNPNSIIVTTQAEKFLNTAKKWARFLSIIGFIGVAFMFVTGIFMALGGTSAATGAYGETTGYVPMLTGMMGSIYLVSSLLYFFPVLYLFKFANSVDKALVNHSGVYLEDSFRHLKNNFQFVGIIIVMTIIASIAMVGFVTYAFIAKPL